MTPQAERIVQVFSTLAPDKLETLARIYHPEARFEDPFHTVHGLAAIEAVFARMYQRLDDPRFEVRRCLEQGRDCVLLWDFVFRLPGRSGPPQRLAGASHLALDAEGLIVDHVDHWDPARGLYEHLPVLGPLMRWVRRRAAA